MLKLCSFHRRIAMDTAGNTEKKMTQRACLAVCAMTVCYLLLPSNVRYYINIAITTYIFIDLIISCFIRIHHDFYHNVTDPTANPPSDTELVIESIVVAILYYLPISFTIISGIILVFFGSHYLIEAYHTYRTRKLIQKKTKQFEKFLDLLSDVAEKCNTKNDRKGNK